MKTGLFSKHSIAVLLFALIGQMAAAQKTSVSNWDGSAAQVVRTFHFPDNTGFFDFNVSQNGQLYVQGISAFGSEAQGSIELIDVSSGQVLQTLVPPTAGLNIMGLAISPGGQWAVAALEGEPLRLWDLTNGQEDFRFSDTTTTDLSYLEWSLNGQEIYVARYGSGTGEVLRLDLASGEVIQTISDLWDPYIEAGIDGVLIAHGADGFADDVPAMLEFLSSDGPPSQALFPEPDYWQGWWHPAGEGFLAIREDQGVSLIDLREPGTSTPIEFGTASVSARWSHSGKQFAVASGPLVSIFEWPSQRSVGACIAPGFEVSWLTWSPNDQYLSIEMLERFTSICDWSTGREVAQFESSGDFDLWVEWTPTGQHILVHDADAGTLSILAPPSP